MRSTTTAARASSVDGGSGAASPGGEQAVASIADGKAIVIVDGYGRVTLRDAATGAAGPGAASGFRAVALSPVRAIAATGSTDTTIPLWDLRKEAAPQRR